MVTGQVVDSQWLYLVVPKNTKAIHSLHSRKTLITRWFMFKVLTVKFWLKQLLTSYYQMVQKMKCKS